MQSENFAFAQYVQEAIKELSKPLEEILPQLIPGLSPSELSSAIGKLFFSDFWFLFLHVAGAERRVKASEAAVLQDILGALGLTFDAKLVSEGQTLRHLYGSWRETVTNQHPPEKLSLRILDALQGYDAQNGTSHTENAKLLFYRMASEIVSADRKMAEEEKSTLTTLRKFLWSSA